MEKSGVSLPDIELLELFNAVQTGLLLCGQDCRFVFANDVAQDFFRRSGLEMNGQPCHKALFSGDGPCEGCPTSSGEDQTGKRQALTIKGQSGDIFLKVFCQRWQGQYLLTIHEVTQEITLLRRSDLDRKELLAKNILLEHRRRQNQEEQEFLAQLMDNLPDALIAVDENFQVQRQNKAVQDMFPGHDGLHCYSVFGKSAPCPDCPAQQGFNEANGQKKSHETGDRSYTEIFSVTPNGTGGLILFRDITRQIDLIGQIRLRREEISNKNKVLSLLVDFGIYLQKGTGISEVAGYFLDAILPDLHAGAAGLIINDIRAGNIWVSHQSGMTEAEWKTVTKACMSRDMQQFKADGLLADTVLPWPKSSQIPLVGAQGQRVGLVLLEGSLGPEDMGILRLVTEPLGAYFQNQLLMRQLEEKANKDALTGLYNRGYLAQAVEEELGKFHGYGIHYALVLGDVNQLKKINDQYGHENGDRLIVTVAEALRSTLRGSDIAARTGGDEFIVLLTNSTDEDAGLFIERLQERVFSGLSITLPDGTEFPITVSLGKAGTDKHPPDSLTKEADRQMYAAKDRFYATVQRYR
ncbi:MAG: GGDEF domain-containing protein [Desulfurivibrio sp.]|nr:GGDEF domain-containing protein [Desulfurivibrio sp.]MBU3937233.1 sensor domain-containing diguanylate cyclase [Pseudomonadota bacterium]MBU4118519.1 sensor domain-containing diguanylate cyclase [Pseudomonadota bacterium]